MLSLIIFAVFVVVSVLMVFGLRRATRRRRIVTIIGLVLGLILVPIWLPWLQVGLYTVKCGQLPVVASTGLASRYYAPHNPYYRKAVSFANPTLFCTEDEAKAQSLQESNFNPAP